MVNDAVVSHNSVNELYYLEEVDSTNTWAKANLDKFGPVGAVYTTSQTAGRGRRGHTWINASGQALYYTVVLKTELAQPESLPLFASMAVADALEQRYGIQCQIKWPNDLLLNGKKIVGILCEGMPDHHAIVCGIGINLAQPQSYFDAADLPHGTYNVTIQVFFNEFFDGTESGTYNFWLDGIRIYNPMGDYADYTKDNEGYPQYIQLHDELVKTAEESGEKKLVFIDGAASATIAEYANYGPNNEVYLANGQAISFKVPENSEIASIQIGAKAPKGTATMTVKGVNVTTELEKPLETATEMYYDITAQAKGGQLVTISNTSGSILSLTNLKITYTKADQKVTLSELTAGEQANAVAMVQALFAAPVETFSPETFQADWGRAVRTGKRATLTVKTSADVESITVDGVTVTSYTTRTERTGWGWWSPKVTYHVFTYTTTAPAQTTDYAVCAVNAEGTASEPITATLTVRPTTWWNWWF